MLQQHIQLIKHQTKQGYWRKTFCRTFSFNANFKQIVHEKV